MRTVGFTSKAVVAKDGREVLLRSPRWADLADLLAFINSLVEEGADITKEKKATREEEADWLGRRLAAVEKGEAVMVVAEVDGTVVANSDVDRRSGLMSHVGGLGIAIKRGYRGIGIGTALMEALIAEAQKMGLKVLILDVFDTNTVAKHLYQKMGFTEVGKIPKGIRRNTHYIDLIRMAREL